MLFSTITSILSVIFAFGLVIFVHELGHFLLAKRNKVRVEKFSLGFGKKLIGFKKGDTEYCISVFPLGGYVKMAGEEPQEGRKTKEGDFLSKPLGPRARIVVAGVGMNFVLACFLMILVSLIGLQVPNYSNRISAVRPNSPAAAMGLKAGDKIVDIEGYTVQDWFSLVEAIDKTAHLANISVVIERLGKNISLAGHIGKDMQGISPYIPAVIGLVIPGLPAHQVGLKAADRILAIDNKEVSQWSEMAGIIRKSAGKELLLEIKRKEAIFIIPIKPEFQRGAGKSYAFIGVEAPLLGYRVKRLGLGKSIRNGMGLAFLEVTTTYKGLWLLITQPRRYGKYLGGPILIAQMAAHESKLGYDRFLYMIARFNIWLAVLNLLPIPILDGGFLMFALIEAIRRRPLKLKTQQVLQQVGMLIIIALFVTVFINDAARQINRVKALRGIGVAIRLEE